MCYLAFYNSMRQLVITPTLLHYLYTHFSTQRNSDQFIQFQDIYRGRINLESSEEIVDFILHRGLEEYYPMIGLIINNGELPENLKQPCREVDSINPFVRVPAYEVIVGECTGDIFDYKDILHLQYTLNPPADNIYIQGESNITR